jgi:AmiR/NasT family two-component response regulator
MEPLSLVVYQNDPRTAHALAVSLSQHFGPVYSAGKQEDVRTAVARHRADVLVLDVEASRSDEVGRLHHELWTEAMNQGAADVCQPHDDQVVRSVLRGRAHRAAAA